MVTRESRDDYDWGMSSWTRTYYGEGPLLLATRSVRRVAKYYRDVAYLTRQGSVESRQWIGCVENLWSGLTDDYGDYLRIISGSDPAADLVEAEVETPILFLDERQKVHGLEIKVSDSVFSSGVVAAELKTSGFWHGESRVLRPETHLFFEPEVVTRDDSRSKLRFHHLPDLRAPVMLVGTVVAHRLREYPARQHRKGEDQPHRHGAHDERTHHRAEHEDRTHDYRERADRTHDYRERADWTHGHEEQRERSHRGEWDDERPLAPVLVAIVQVRIA